MSSVVSTFEILPNEMILHVCQYLRVSDVLYGFFDLNSRLNCAISGYCQLVNLLVVSHKQFDYVVSNILPKIGHLVISFSINSNWNTIMSKTAYNMLFNIRIASIFPQLERLTLKSFNGDKLLSYLDLLQNHPNLVKLDIQCLQAPGCDTLLTRVLHLNNGQLTSVTFDSKSSPLELLESEELIPCTKLQELKVNLVSVQVLPLLFKLLPNIRRLHVNCDELSECPTFNETWIGFDSLTYLVEFQLSSINLFWTLSEISSILYLMPSLERLGLDLRTVDKQLTKRENLVRLLPITIRHIDLFIRYYVEESVFEKDDLHRSYSTDSSMACIVEKTRNRIVFHSVPLGLHSVILSALESKQMLSGWHYMSQVKDLHVHSAKSLDDVLRILEHFRGLRTLRIHMIDGADALIGKETEQNIILKLPKLRKLEIDGICGLFSILEASPKLFNLTISFNCLKSLLDDRSTCRLLQERITRLDIMDFPHAEIEQFKRIAQVFCNIYELVLGHQESETTMDSTIVEILDLWYGKKLVSLYVKGVLSSEANQDIQQWIVEHSHLRKTDSFSVQYHDNFFDLWQ